MQLAELPPEQQIVADHNAMILMLQKQIVEAAQARPYYTFRNLVFLCWQRSGKFGFEKMYNLELQSVLDDIREGVRVAALHRRNGRPDLQLLCEGGCV